jgi:hypothetical protein
MRKSLLAAILGAAALAAPVGAGGSPPGVKLVARSPITVAGWRFAPRERVQVTVFSIRKVTLPTRTTRTGTFRLVFQDLTFSHCGGVRIRAVGAHGEVALAKLPLPACLPA